MKLDVKQVLSEAAAFYQRHFKEIAGVAFINLLLSLIVSVANFLQESLEGFDPSSVAPGLMIVMAILRFILIVFMTVSSFILLPKLPLMIMILINSFFSKQETLRNAYYRTGGKYWLTVRCFLLIGLLALPAFCAMVYFEIPYNNYLATVCYAFVSPFFFTLIPMIALEPKSKRYLRRAFQMIRGNYIPLLILTVLCRTLLAVAFYIVSGLFAGSRVTALLVDIVYYLVLFFVSPFADTVTVLVYRKLTRQSTREAVEML